MSFVAWLFCTRDSDPVLLHRTVDTGVWQLVHSILLSVDCIHRIYTLSQTQISLILLI